MTDIIWKQHNILHKIHPWKRSQFKKEESKHAEHISLLLICHSHIFSSVPARRVEYSRFMYYYTNQPVQKSRFIYQNGCFQRAVRPP